jgi:hypothetical protein
MSLRSVVLQRRQGAECSLREPHVYLEKGIALGHRPDQDQNVGSSGPKWRQAEHDGRYSSLPLRLSTVPPYKGRRHRSREWPRGLGIRHSILIVQPVQYCLMSQPHFFSVFMLCSQNE